MATDSTPRLESVSALADDLYAGTLDEQAWSRAILGIADSVRASGALLMAFNPATGAVLRGEQHRLDPALLMDYRRYWSYEDLRLPAALDTPVGCPMTELTLDIPNWGQSAILNEFLIPADVPHFLPVWLVKSPSKAAALSLQGTRKRGPFEMPEIRLLAALSGHLRRAVEIRDRLERARIRTETLGRALDSAPFGVLVLDAAGRIHEANESAAELLRQDDGICRSAGGVLRLREPAGHHFSRWIATGLPPAESLDGLLHVPRMKRLPLSIMLAPLPQRATLWLGSDPKWLLLVFDPERRLIASQSILARDLGITLREAEFAAYLVAGLGLPQCAMRLGVSVHTARNHLKSIFRKTGARTQSELVAKVLLGPASSPPADSPKTAPTE